MDQHLACQLAMEVHATAILAVNVEEQYNAMVLAQEELRDCLLVMEVHATAMRVAVVEQ